MRKPGIAFAATIALLVGLLGAPGAMVAAGADDDPDPRVTVRIYFPDSDRSEECDDVYPVRRRVRPPIVATRAIRRLLRGPTEAERDRGYGGWFSAETAGMLNSINIRSATAYVDFEDFSGVIPNASASCGSALLLAQLDRTLLQFPTIKRTRYSFDGDEDAFYEWLQMSSPE